MRERIIILGIFNNKYFNSEVFAQYLESVPRVKQDALVKAGVLRSRPDLATSLVDGVGGSYLSVPMAGRIGGEALNYDGTTSIEAEGIDGYQQSMIVVGRMKAWQEKDFTKDLTGKDFMEVIAAQVANYWDEVDAKTMLATLKGIFGVSAFATAHTLDISSETVNAVGATTLNSAIAKAAGDNKKTFTCAIMHSTVATNLENLEVLEYRKQTDANGIQREIGLADWNGRTVLIDDDMPTEDASGSTKYTTYILGEGAFDYVNCGAAVPSEVWRDPNTNGGVDRLITRQRKIYAPRGFSFVQPTSGAAIVSPTDEQLETAARWAVVKSANGTGLFPSKAIPFARIISKG